MLSRSLRLVTLKGVLRAVPSRSYNGVSNWKRASMDEYMVPHGCWQDDYNRRNAQFTKVLVAGVLSVIATFYAGYQLGPLKFYTGPNKYDYKCPEP